ncbi:MAG TPA: D-aminoacyl-tRNA deacylase [Steroidobacteraceae bacterium]
MHPTQRMIGLIQRVSEAAVRVDGEAVGQIGRGLLVLVGFRRGDDEATADRLLERVLNYRVFPDDSGRMNLSVRDVSGDLLLVSQFTLAADTHKGTRAGFSTAAAPDEARRLFDYLVEKARRVPGLAEGAVATGVFGADMKVSLINDGPVTFWLES